MEKGEGRGDGEDNKTDTKKDEWDEIIAPAKGEAIEIWPNLKEDYTGNIGNCVDDDRCNREETGSKGSAWEA